jgi:hypothetical protein
MNKNKNYTILFYPFSNRYYPKLNGNFLTINEVSGCIYPIVINRLNISVEYKVLFFETEKESEIILERLKKQFDSETEIIIQK